MSDDLCCYRCGASLAVLTPPISRQDECPGCANYLHVCRMCRHFDPGVPKQCREDDAEEVFEKEKLNFCDWYEPSANAFDPARKRDEDKARDALTQLFDDGPDRNPGDSGDDDALRDAEDLFK